MCSRIWTEGLILLTGTVDGPWIGGFCIILTIHSYLVFLLEKRHWLPTYLFLISCQLLHFP